MASPLTQDALNAMLASFFSQLTATMKKDVEELNTRLLNQVEARMQLNMSVVKDATVSSLNERLGGLSVSGSASKPAKVATADGTAPKTSRVNANIWFANKFAKDTEFRSTVELRYPETSKIQVQNKKDEETRAKAVAGIIWGTLSEADKDDYKKQKQAEEKNNSQSVADATSSAPLPSALNVAPAPATFAAPAPSVAPTTFAAPAPATFTAPSFKH